jgi:hypothetical protein
MKRKEKLDMMERERFAKNMAQMAGSTKKGETNRWAALRGFITETLDQKNEFKEK